jgi:hypothetical protein
MVVKAAHQSIVCICCQVFLRLALNPTTAVCLRDTAVFPFLCKLLNRSSTSTTVVRAALGVIARFVFAPSSAKEKHDAASLSNTSRLFLSDHVDTLLSLCEGSDSQQNLGMSYFSCCSSLE